MQELVPSAVPVPLEALTRDPALGLRLLAGGGPPGREHRVTSVHTSEMADPRPYLLGGELLLSAGVHHDTAGDTGTGAGPDPGAGAGGEEADAYWEAYARRVVEARAGALGFGIAPRYDAVPSALVAACEELGLPLLEVPRSTTFTAVARAVWQAMTELRHRELRGLSDAQQTLVAAAARPHPVPAVLGQLARHLGGWAALYGQDGEELATAGAAPETAVCAELASLARLLRPGPSSAAGTHGRQQLSAYGLGGRDRLVLGLCTPAGGSGGPAEVDGTSSVARVAVVLLSLLTESRAAVTDARRSAALVRLMLGDPAPDVAPLLAESGRWSVVHGRRRGRGAAPGGREDDPFVLSALAAGLGTQLLDVDGGTLRALVPDDGTGIAPQTGWTLGVSAPVAPDGLGQGDAEAARALRRALAERSGLVRQPAEGGAGTEGLAGLVPPAEREAHARQRLASLAGQPVLVETVRMWLSLHGSWDRTAVALGVHRNTVRQRIARARGLLGVDLDDPDVRMELWFALKWLPG